MVVDKATATKIENGTITQVRRHCSQESHRAIVGSGWWVDPALATVENGIVKCERYCKDGKWRACFAVGKRYTIQIHNEDSDWPPSISLFPVRVVRIRVEAVAHISDDDAIAAGVTLTGDNYEYEVNGRTATAESPTLAYQHAHRLNQPYGYMDRLEWVIDLETI